MKKPVQCLTSTYTGITRVLKNEIHISKSFDSSSIPKPINPTKVGAKPFTAIWDTGATGTMISQKVVDECGLKQIGVVEVSTANDKRLSPVYLASIFLPNHVFFSPVRVVEGTISEGDALIGMDIITRGDFVITNSDGRTTFSYRWPSTEKIDFVEQLKSSTTPKI